jgi:hypothetical protein
MIGCLLLAQTMVAQKPVANEFSAIDAKALKLPDSLAKTTEGISTFINLNFNTDREKTRAIFIWLASNIEYDIENMFALNFYESKEEKINKALRSGKGICESYAALFNDICLKCGIKSFVIEGYTKQNGFADYIPHAWCAAQIDTSWFMFDPTWGSGYISGGKFVKKINNQYYQSPPSLLIKSHIPFDYLWQFLHYPVSNQEFYEGKTALNKLKPFFNYRDSIELYEQLDYVEQLLASSRRIEKNGIRNSLIFDRLQHNKLEIENIRQNKMIDLYNAAVARHNEAINHFNIFIHYLNNQFTPLKPDPEIQQMMDTVGILIKESEAKLKQIEYPDPNTALLMSPLKKLLAEIASQVKEQQDWLTIYFSRNKQKRKAMFYEKKVTWFGVPVN